MNNIADDVSVNIDGRALELLQQSRTETGRQLLVDHSATALLPPALKRISQICLSDMQQPQYWDALTWMLQVTRNLCAAGDAACTSFLQAGLLDTVIDLTDQHHCIFKGINALPCFLTSFPFVLAALNQH